MHKCFFMDNTLSLVLLIQCVGSVYVQVYMYWNCVKLSSTCLQSKKEKMCTPIHASNGDDIAK